MTDSGSNSADDERRIRKCARGPGAGVAGGKGEEERMSDISITIPVELTQSMIIRAGRIADEKRALALAHELHDVVLKCVQLFRARKRRLVEHPKGPDGEDDPDAEPIELEEAREPNPLELADFTLACWRQALVGGEVSSDDGEGRWIAEELASLLPVGDPDQLFVRWEIVCDLVTGSDLATFSTEGCA
jgi:hypothetical protein